MYFVFTFHEGNYNGNGSHFKNYCIKIGIVDRPMHHIRLLNSLLQKAQRTQMIISSG